MHDAPELDHEPAELEPGPLWRRAAEVLEVSFPSRTIELVVIPYEQPTEVGWEGRTVRETIARGAFDGIQRRANRVRVNVDHNETVAGTIGRAVAFHPSREVGLVAEVKIANTQLGTDALELAADGDLGASAGFRPMRGGMQWETRDAYRITKAFLKHIALTPDPAYPGAQVLAVRSGAALAPAGAAAFPNLELVRQMLLQDRVKSDPLYR
jgi:HK97 family phage prohead protease